MSDQTKCVGGKRVALEVERILKHNFKIGGSEKVKIENAQEGDIWMFIKDYSNSQSSSYRGISITQDGLLKIRELYSGDDDLLKSDQAARSNRNRKATRFDPKLVEKAKQFISRQNICKNFPSSDTVRDGLTEEEEEELTLRIFTQ